MHAKMDFQDYQSPPAINYKEVDATATRDMESSIGEDGVAQPLYNAEIYGSLRKGGPVKLFSMDCVGLVAATFASAFSLECLNSVIQPMLKEHFRLKPAKLAASHRLTSIPSAFCFFFGLLSDCYPIMGFRRKGYLIIGLVTTVLGLFCLSGMDMYIESLEENSAGTGLAVVTIGLAMLTSTGNMLTYMCVHTRVMELAQREPLGMRGTIVANYSVVRYVGCMITDACVYALRRRDTHHCVSLLVFGFVIALSIPLVWKAWQEKYYSLSIPMKTRSRILWKVMQQKAVWRILVFLCFITLFSNITFIGPSIVVSVWAGASADDPFIEQLIYYGMICVTVLVWRHYFMNRSWRVFFAMHSFLLIASQAIVAVLVTQDILRNRYFYHFMTLFSSIGAGVGWLASMVPLTEIIQEGSEGAMVGLVVSLYSLVVIFVESNSTGLLAGTNFYKITEVALDTSGARSDVLTAMLLNYGINAFGFIGLYFLPRQKLDTQQLRSYGGYTKCASAAILTFALMLFVYSMTITVLTLNPSTSCMSFAGGDGCSS